MGAVTSARFVGIGGVDMGEGVADAMAEPAKGVGRSGVSDPGRSRAVLLAVLLTLAVAAVAGCCVVTSAALAFGTGWFFGTESAAPNYAVTHEDMLEFGEAGTGTIDGVDRLHVWYFEGAEGEWVVIRVEGQDGCDPHVGLTTEDGLLLADDDDGGGGYAAVILTQLPADGIYAVRVGAWNGGDYVILLRHYFPGEPNAALLRDGRWVGDVGSG